MGQLAITGTANQRQLSRPDNEIGNVDENKATVDALVAVYNANMDVNLMDLSNNTALAKGEMYTYEDKYCYTDWQTNKEICHYYYEEALGLRFDDDTMIDFEDFVDDGAGFGELIDAFNRLAQAYENYIN